jgi:hypothetical protein
MHVVEYLSPAPVTVIQYPAAPILNVAINAGYNHAAKFACVNKKAAKRSDQKKKIHAD